MRIIPKNTKVSTEFFKGVTLADMIVGFIGILVIFLIAVSSLPYRGYIALGFAFILVFLLVRIDDESNYMFLFRIIRHLSYYRSYRKPGFVYPADTQNEGLNEMQNSEEQTGENAENHEEMLAVETQENGQEIQMNEWNTKTSGTSLDVSEDMLVLESNKENIEEKQKKEMNPLHSELKEDGFEILDLDEISVDETSEIKITDVVVDKKKKAPQSVWKNMRNKLSKEKKGDF